jgi:hypothetical protein
LLARGRRLFELERPNVEFLGHREIFFNPPMEQIFTGVNQSPAAPSLNRTLINNTNLLRRRGTK